LRRPIAFRRGHRRLYAAIRFDLTEWTERLREEAGADLPQKVTAFARAWRARTVSQACPVCGSPVQRIVYAENETKLLRALPDRRQDPRRPRGSRACSRRAGGGRSTSSSRSQAVDDDADHDSQIEQHQPTQARLDRLVALLKP